MRRYPILAGVVLPAIVGLGLAGCGVNNCASNHPSPAAVAAPTPTLVDTVKSDGNRGLRCADGFTPLDLGIGGHSDLDGGDYKVDEIRGAETPYTDVQLYLTVHIQLPPGESAPTGVVQVMSHADREFNFGLHKGGRADFKLETNNYIYLPGVYNEAIGPVTLCIWKG